MNTVRKIPENFNIKEDVLLSEKTTFKVGGPAHYFAAPKDIPELVELLKFCSGNGFPFFILGGGSNLVVNDEGLDKLVISTENLNEVKNLSLSNEEKIVLSCQCGTTIKQLTDFCIGNGFSGLESFAGLPGTVGGASFMNARCFNVSFSERISFVNYIDSDCKIKTYRFDEKDWAYKISPFQKMIAQGECLCIIEVGLNVAKGDSEEIRNESEKHIQFREEKGHFKYPSAGSVFKNNHDFGKPSGQIVDECGLRGLSVGGAQVAPWHGNFIINNGNASASDIRSLVEQVKSKVLEKTGFSLECEILFV